MVFICPVCGGALAGSEGTIRCKKNHSFDIAKQGYVNLLRSAKAKGTVHGDDKQMVAARTRFLDAGFYAPLREAIVLALKPYLKNGMVIADAGCGECFYTSAVYEAVQTDFSDGVVAGVDISKDALIAGAKRCKGLQLAVASLFAMPFANESCDIVLNIFSPNVNSEFLRILRKGGVLLKVIPLENHLMELKTAIYDSPYPNQPGDTDIHGAELVAKHELRYSITCTGTQIHDLFTMTPYYYKTAKEDSRKLDSLHSLETTAEFCVLVYIKS